MRVAVAPIEQVAEVLGVVGAHGGRAARRLRDGRWECVAVDGHRVHVVYTEDRGEAARFVETGARPR